MGAVTAPPASPLCETSTLSSRRWEVIDRREMGEVAGSTLSVRTADLQGARCKVHEVPELLSFGAFVCVLGSFCTRAGLARELQSLGMVGTPLSCR